MEEKKKLKLVAVENFHPEQEPESKFKVDDMKAEIRFWFLHYKNTGSNTLQSVVSRWKTVFSSELVDRYVGWIGDSVYRELLGKRPHFTSTIREEW